MRPPSPILHEQLLNEFDRYLLSGGLPEVVKAFNKDHDYEAVAKDILIEQEEDFVRKESVTKIDLFQDSLRAVANSLGSQFKLTTTDHKYHDAKKIMNLLSSWKLVYLIEQKSTVPNTKMSPKMYMYDLGIASQLRNMPFPQIGLLESKDPTLRIPLGGLFENAVLIELMSDTLGRLTISSWRKKSGTDIEVDFVWRHKNQLIPIECKATLNATKRHFKNLVHYNKFTGSTCGFLISAAPYRTFKHGAFKLVNLPIYLVQSSNLLREYSQ